MQMETKKKSGIAILISEKIDFRDKEGHCIINGSIQEEDITITNTFALPQMLTKATFG